MEDMNMNRIIRFSIINHADHAAGINRVESDAEIRLDWYDDDALPEMVEIFRQALKDAYDTPDVRTDLERAEQYR